MKAVLSLTSPDSLHYERLASIVHQFDRARVLVIGDLILDEFIWGHVSRISPEAPIPVVLEKSKSFMPGGACNVANNIVALDGQSSVVGVIGTEGLGRLLLDLLRERRIDVRGILKDSSRPTTFKTRVIAHHQQVVRIDREKMHAISPLIHKRMLGFIQKNISKFDALCIEDYGKGVITPKLVKEIVRLARREKKVITVDPKEGHLLYYRNVTSMTPNHHEASGLSNIPIHNDVSLKKAGDYLMRELRTENLIITLGENGMCLFQKGKKPVKIATLAKDVFDVSGAGDTVIGTYTMALALGAQPIEAAYLANCAAGIVVGKVGTATVTRDELLQYLKQLMKKQFL